MEPCFLFFLCLIFLNLFAFVTAVPLMTHISHLHSDPSIFLTVLFGLPPVPDSLQSVTDQSYECPDFWASQPACRICESVCRVAVIYTAIMIFMKHVGTEDS